MGQYNYVESNMDADCNGENCMEASAQFLGGDFCLVRRREMTPYDHHTSHGPTTNPPSYRLTRIIPPEHVRRGRAFGVVRR